MADNIARLFAAAIATDPDPTPAHLVRRRHRRAHRALRRDPGQLGRQDREPARRRVRPRPRRRRRRLLPPHWQTAAILLGCWTAGLTVARRAGAPVDVLFAAADRAAEAAGLVGRRPVRARRCARSPLPLRQVPAGFADYVVEARAHGDHFAPYPARRRPARRRAAGPRDGPRDGAGHRPGDRVLIDARRTRDPVDWLLAPLVAGASVVLCAAPRPATASTGPRRSPSRSPAPLDLRRSQLGPRSGIARPRRRRVTERGRAAGQRATAASCSKAAQRLRVGQGALGGGRLDRGAGEDPLHRHLELLADSVRGTARTWWISSGTCRGRQRGAQLAGDPAAQRVVELQARRRAPRTAAARPRRPRRPPGAPPPSRPPRRSPSTTE